MTRNEILRRFPHAKESFIRLNLDPESDGLCAVNPQPAEGRSLGEPVPREETRWYDAAERFEIQFIVYSMRPCDWDGYDIKALQDFCVAAGIIPDDGWKTLTGRIVPAKAASKDKQRTEIVIIAKQPEKEAK